MRTRDKIFIFSQYKKSDAPSLLELTEAIMSRTEKRLSAISLILIAVMIFTAVFNVFYVGSATGVKVPSATQTPTATGNGFVESDINLDSVREQYLNHELVEKNTASYDGDRWVIVELKGDTLYDAFKKSTRYNDFASYGASVEGQKMQAAIKADHTSFLNKLDRHGIDYQIQAAYTAITNALALKVNAEGYNAIKKMSDVSDVYYAQYYDVPKVAVENNANVYTTGIYNTEGIEEKGEGMVVAILDTGLDHTHEAFQNMPEAEKDGTLTLTKDKVQSLVNNGSNGLKLMANGTADDFYYNAKVPFAYDYADDDPNVYPSYSSHGTHVAGIVAGSSDYVVNKGHDETVKDETFVGVAPEAQLVICKVFTDNLDSNMLGGANTMGILSARNDCALLGVDVINMSLGSSAGFTNEPNDTQQNQLINRVYSKIEELGISLVVAASNDYSAGFGGANGTNLASNPDSGTVGSPSTYSSALSVASINGRKASYITAKNRNGGEDPVAFITNSSNEFGQEFKFIDQLYELASKNRGTTVAKGTDLKFKYVAVNGAGRTSDYTPSVRNQLSNRGNYDGVIVMVQRGDTTFAEKVQVAMSAGADACIIYNNVSGTIRMSLGDVEDPIPTCSISMDAGKAFVANISTYGEITVNSNYLAGPFMSEFSSWGPTPNLELKPEITAHGGEIISAVASGYDKLSGTSMAAPNMSGAVALLRQNLKKKNPDLKGSDLNAFVNQMLMSTATIAYNEEGNPYSPRKQGAGLAGIADAIQSEGYITVLDSEGKTRDKTKIELYDDPDKNGIYTLDFIMHNLTDKPQTYNPITYVMTETMSSDNKTVAEKAYMLNSMCDIKYSVSENGRDFSDISGTVTVDAESTLSVKVVITLNQSARNYLDKNFVNGMYVEGFVSMQAAGDTKITLGLPYLAFYGDWGDAPLFDYDVYEVAEDEQNTELEDYEKRKASSAATMAIGRYYGDEYILPLGTYIYKQDEEDVEIYPDRDKIAISMFDDDSGHTIYELYMVYAGLLRGAKEMDVVITDNATGEIIYENNVKNVRKSYAGGGANRGAPIMLEVSPREWGLKNNSSYSVSLKGKIDHKDDSGEYVETSRNTWEFPFTVDYEDPEMLSYKIRFMPYTENRVVKYRIYMDIVVRDNQYVQTVLPCYMKKRPSGEYVSGIPVMENVLTLLTEYPIPVMGQKGEATTVSFEITDIYDEFIKNGGSETNGKMYIRVEDYAMNATNYTIIPGWLEGENAMSDPVKVEFETDERLKKTGEKTDSLGTVYSEYNLTIDPYTLYTFKPTSSDVVMKSLTWSGGGSRVKAQGDEVFSNAASGVVTLTLTNTTAASSGGLKTYAKVIVKITNQNYGRIPTLESIQMNAALNSSGSSTSLNPGGSATPVLELNPEQSLKLTWSWTPWYCDKPEVTWTTSNENVVSVTQDGTITALQKGQAYITVRAKDKNNVFKMIKVEVGRPYNVSNFTLYDYYGKGKIEIPSNLNIMYLDEDCFKGNTEIEEIILPTSLTEIPENAFLGCINLKKVVIPGQCTVIKANAFKNCTSLTTIELGLFVDSERNELGPDYAGTLSIGRNAFEGCEMLQTITNQKRITTIYERAFENCIALKEIDLSNVRAVANGAFKGCTGLLGEKVTTTEHTAIGVGMFENCTGLTSFEFYGSAVPADAFKGCTNLASINFHSELSSIGSNAFERTKLTNVTLPDSKDGFTAIDRDAFKDSSLTKLTLSPNTKLDFDRNTAFTECNNFTEYALAGASEHYTVNDGVLYGNGGQQLVAVPYAKTSFTVPSGVTSIANGALSGVNVTSIDLRNVTTIGKYAFAGNTVVTSVTLPSGLTEIPEGLFDGCLALNSVIAADGFANVTKIGDNAFRGCAALETFAAANVARIGMNAFEESGITALPGNLIEDIGANAFANTKLTGITLSKAVSIGDGAFANISTLVEVRFNGGLKSVEGAEMSDMGEGVFVGSTGITTVVFGEGTKSIGKNAFSSDSPVITAINVTLPASLKFIGEQAFYNRSDITINLDNVEYIDQLAFAYIDPNNASAKGGLTGANLANVKQIGYGAFANNRLTAAEMPRIQLIGAFAFNGNSGLTTVTLGALERLGSYAFIGTAITHITLPATFNKYTHDYVWNTYDDETHDIEREGLVRQELNFEAAALSGMNSLVSITVDGEGEENDTYFTKDGVLYAKTYRRVETVDKATNKITYSYELNGYVLLQYPSMKSGAEYTVLDGTVIIGESAFEYTRNLNKVTFPYSVNTIGSAAFFQSTCTEFVFNSVEAPVLLAAYISEDEFPENSGDPLIYNLRRLFRRELTGNINTTGMACTNFYNNFSYYAVLADPMLWIDGADDFHLTMTIPLNGRGYDGIWKLFFSTINRTEKNLPDNSSHKAMEAIDKLPTVNEINSKTDYEQIKVDSEIGKLVKEAREAYNKVVLPEQVELMSEYYDVLMSIEAALRARKAALGHPVQISNLVMSKRPDKIRYNVGEDFDPTGMVLTAIYDDGSEVALTGSNYDINPRTITKDTTKVTITYIDPTTGQVVRTDIFVNVNLDTEGGDDPGINTNPGDGNNGKKLTGGEIAGIVIGVVLGLGAIAGAVVAIVLVKKKKSNGAKTDDTKAESDETKNTEENTVDVVSEENTVDVVPEEITAETAESNSEVTGDIQAEENAEENDEQQNDGSDAVNP